MPPDEIGLCWPRTNMSEFAAHSVDPAKERGSHRLLIDIRNNEARSFAVGENAVMNRRVW